MHVKLEDLVSEKGFNSSLRSKIEKSGRLVL